MGCTKFFFTVVNSIVSGRNGLCKFFLSIQINSFSISIWPVQTFLTVVNSIVSGRNGLCKFFLSIQINSFSISIWPVQNFLTVVNSIASGRNGLCNFFKMSDTAIYVITTAFVFKPYIQATKPYFKARNSLRREWVSEWQIRGIVSPVNKRYRHGDCFSFLWLFEQGFLSFSLSFQFEY